jgi:hypothetical protein
MPPPSGVWAARVTWCLYPPLISFVVIVTGNHHLTDVVLGAINAGARGSIT